MTMTTVVAEGVGNGGYSDGFGVGFDGGYNGVGGGVVGRVYAAAAVELVFFSYMYFLLSVY